jgi:GNAT superfamily N-acetyltransferase
MAKSAFPTDGYHPLAPGKLAAVVTYLEMTAAPAASPLEPVGWRLEAIGADVARYRRLFAAVGEPWLWNSRRVIDDAALAAILEDPRVEAFAVREGDRDVGLVELDFRSDDPEVAFFGFVPDRTRRGLGRSVMAHAVARAFAHPGTRRLFLHTCTLDDPRAIPFYQACGFTPYARAMEVLDDPRLTGAMPRGCAPHVPVIGA